MEKQMENQLGNRIAELRKEAGLTQEQLAGMLGVTYQAVSKWETGNSYPDISLLPRLSEIFHVTLDSLFGKEENSILTEHVLEKAVKAASMDVSSKENDMFTDEDHEVESDSAQSFGEYVGNIVNMSLKSGMNGLEKAVDALKKIDFKNLDLKDIDRSMGNKLKSAMDKGKKGNIFIHFGSNEAEGEEEQKEECSSEETWKEKETSSQQDDFFQEMEGWGGKKQEDVPWGDDGKIRAVVYLGKTMLNVREYRNMKGKMTLELEGNSNDVITYMNVTCENVGGNIKAGGNVTCDMVHGNVGAENNVTCDDVTGSVFAGGNVICNDIKGNVAAGGNVECDMVNQNVTAGGSVECDRVYGNVTANQVFHN